MVHFRTLLILFFTQAFRPSAAMELATLSQSDQENAQNQAHAKLRLIEQKIVKSKSGTLKELVALRLVTRHVALVQSALGAIPTGVIPECKMALARMYFLSRDYQELKAIGSVHTLFVSKNDIQEAKSSCFTAAQYRPTRHPRNPFLVTSESREEVKFGFMYKEKNFDWRIPLRLRCPHIPEEQDEERKKFLHNLESAEFLDYRNTGRPYDMLPLEEGVAVLCAGPNKNNFMIVARGSKLHRYLVKQQPPDLSGGNWLVREEVSTYFHALKGAHDTTVAVAISQNKDDYYMATKSGKLYAIETKIGKELGMCGFDAPHEKRLTKDEMRRFVDPHENFKKQGYWCFWKEKIDFILHALPIDVDGAILDLVVGFDDVFLWILSSKALYRYELKTKKLIPACVIPEIPSDAVIEMPDGQFIVKEEMTPETAQVFTLSPDGSYAVLGGSQGTVLLADFARGSSFILDTFPVMPIADIWWNSQNKIVILSRSGAVRSFTIAIGLTETCTFQ